MSYSDFPKEIVRELKRKTLIDLLRDYPNGLLDDPQKGWLPKYLSYNRSITIEVIEAYPDWEWNWEGLSRYLPLSIDLIERYSDKWCWISIAFNNTFGTEMVEKYRDLIKSKFYCWECIPTEEFLDSLQGEFKWGWVSSNKNFPVDLLEKFSDKIDWGVMSSNSALSGELIKTLIDKLDKEQLIANPNLTPELFEELILIPLIEANDLQGIMRLAHSRYLTMELIDKHKIIELCGSIEEEFISDYYSSFRYKNLLWYRLENNPNLTLPFIIEHENQWSWIELSRNRYLNSQILNHYKDKLNYYYLSGNDAVPYTFILDNLDKPWNRGQLSARSYLPSINNRVTKSARKII